MHILRVKWKPKYDKQKLNHLNSTLMIFPYTTSHIYATSSDHWLLKQSCFRIKEKNLRQETIWGKGKKNVTQWMCWWLQLDLIFKRTRRVEWIGIWAWGKVQIWNQLINYITKLILVTTIIPIYSCLSKIKMNCNACFTLRTPNSISVSYYSYNLSAKSHNSIQRPSILSKIMNHLKPTLIEAWEKLKHISKHKVYLNYDIITGWGLRKPKAWVHPYPWHNGQNYQQNITEINKSFFNFILFFKKNGMIWTKAHQPSSNTNML